MIFHRNSRKLLDQVLDMHHACGATRGQRNQFYNDCMDFYLKGSTDGRVARTNKIKPVIKRQSSFLYSAESIKFWVDAPPDEDSEATYKRVDPVSMAIGMSWTDTGLDTKFGTAVRFSRVFGSYIVATLPRMRTDGRVDLISYPLHPKYFGVHDDSVPELENQQACMLAGYYPMESIEARIRLHPNRNKILNELSAAGRDPQGFGEQVIEGISPGSAQYNAAYYKRQGGQYDSKSPIQYYAFNDVYAFDDDLGDYRVFTITGDTIVWDRPIRSIGIPGCLPFVKVCPEEHPEYFWGISLVDDLKNLQLWNSDREDDVDNLIQQILDPPTAGIGLGQSFEEKIAAFRKPGGKIATPTAAASIQQFVPNMPDSVFEFLGRIDQQLMDQSNMRPSMFGKQESGVRTEGMAASMLRVAGAEMREMGMLVEKAAQSCAQILFRYLRRYSTDKLIDEDGNKFLLAEFPDDVRVRVDGHSSSPLFVEDNAQLAMGLIRYGAITEETLVRMLHPVLEGKILADLKKIQFAKLVAREQMKLQQEQKRSGKASAGV